MEQDPQAFTGLSEEEKAKLVLHLLNMTFYDIEEQHSAESIKVSTILFHACLTWLKVRRFPAIFDEENQVYQHTSLTEKGK